MAKGTAVHCDRGDTWARANAEDHKRSTHCFAEVKDNPTFALLLIPSARSALIQSEKVPISHYFSQRPACVLHITQGSSFNKSTSGTSSAITD